MLLLKTFFRSNKVYQGTSKCAICLENTKISFECKICNEGKYCNKCFKNHFNSKYGKYCPCCKSESNWYNNIYCDKISINVIEIKDDPVINKENKICNKLELGKVCILVSCRLFLVIFIFTILSLFIGMMFNPSEPNSQDYMLYSILIGGIISLLLCCCITKCCKINIFTLYICQ